MIRKASLMVMVGLSLVLVACSAAATTEVPTRGPQNLTLGGGAANGGGTTSGTPRALNEETKLALGIFKLEGTPNAVTAAEAKTLLPLWQQIKTMSSAANGAQATPVPQADLQAVYTQIQGALTPDQVSAINGMNLTQSDIQAMMTQLGIQITPGAGFGGGGNNNGTPFPTLSPDERATRTTQRETQVASGTRAPGGAYPAPNGTPGAGFGGRGGGAGFGFANMFLDPLIKLLQTRAGS